MCVFFFCVTERAAKHLGKGEGKIEVQLQPESQSPTETLDLLLKNCIVNFVAETTCKPVVEQTD